MKSSIMAGAAALAFLGYSTAGLADDRLVRFEGGIGEIPVSTPATPNVVRGVSPGGQPWVISRLSADVRSDGRISVEGRGLLLACPDPPGRSRHAAFDVALEVRDRDRGGSSDPAGNAFGV